MKRPLIMKSRRILAAMCVLLLAQSPLMLYAQLPQPENQQSADPEQPIQLLSPNQLEDLVAPIAIYPDPLVSQILVATTYPLEVVEAYQWLQRNPGLTGPALTQAAEAQNWDPSVQALVMFPDIMQRLNEDIAWITNLGNAFLAQPADVMNAIQRMRLKAQQAGKLVSTPQQQVITTLEAGQNVVAITPTNPEVIYVPVYDPVWIWGPAVYYPYPRWYFAPHPHVVFFGAGIRIVDFLGGGWGGWSSWGWYPGWATRSVIINNSFLHRYNFNSRHITTLTGTTTWSHDAFHRHGVPYPTSALTERFRAGVRQNLRPREMPGPARAVVPSRPSPLFATPGERMGNRPIAPNAPNRNRSAFGGIENGPAARLHTDHGYSSLGPARTGSASRHVEPAPRRDAPASRGIQNRGQERRR
ncbi:MAG: DUF3300 domain-containing protein [Acidobacteria bacterium]|nr:MAG: DUF3300 domain-containing protein [Acidobacteriota bacterium]